MSATNNAVFVGRLAADPTERWTQGEKQMCIAEYRIAVQRRVTKDDKHPVADFIPCKCFGKAAEFAVRYFKKGTKVAVAGPIQTNSYTNKDGVKVFTWECMVQDQDFVESRASAQQYQQSQGQQQSPQQQYGGYPQQNYQQQNFGQNFNQGFPQNNAPMQQQYQQQPQQTELDGFMNIPDGIGADELPFA